MYTRHRQQISRSERMAFKTQMTKLTEWANYFNILGFWSPRINPCFLDTDEEREQWPGRHSAINKPNKKHV